MATEQEKKEPAYRTRLKSERADELYVRILAQLTQGRRYRNPDYTAAQLARELGTNSRYISATVALRTGSNYSALVNGFRLRDARHMLRSARYAHLSAEEIGLLAGFASRQSFYAAFRRTYGITPRTYRLQAGR